MENLPEISGEVKPKGLRLERSEFANRFYEP